MKINGMGLIIMNVNETMNYFEFKDKIELRDMLFRFYKKQGVKDITVINFKDKSVVFVDDDNSYDEIVKESE